ncbi:HET-domain-containing protein [Glonium stellatum]|uniref:HET-domain-containing protein n=1 Tax=Glonium stellatum TaxID=574774 RepID=A0A8E2JVQ6_9PEZI|nr:HET-domain-containing protein [Glonium stellatum]
MLATRVSNFASSTSGVQSKIFDTAVVFNLALGNGGAAAQCFNADSVTCLWTDDFYLVISVCHPGVKAGLSWLEKMNALSFNGWSKSRRRKSSQGYESAYLLVFTEKISNQATGSAGCYQIPASIAVRPIASLCPNMPSTAVATICDICKTSILESGRSWGFHQNSFESLKKAAEGRCTFCYSLAKEVKELDKHIGFLVGAKWPLHRWSIRSLARAREGKEAVAVTFRPIPHGDDQWRDRKQEASAADFGLSERIFYLFPERELGYVLNEGDIGPSTNPRISGRTQIKKWIKNCDKNHKHCPARDRPSGSFVPTRLLALGGVRKGPIRVVETAPNGIKGPYASLSHCWGLIPFVQLTTENRKQFMEEGIPWDELPKNFQEAIEIARFLEIEYIWIDSLCIIQKGTDGDFNKQAPLMHKIYRNSYCNIAAADSSDSTGGLFRNREAYHVLPARYQGEGQSPMFRNEVWRIVSEDLWNCQLLQTPIYKRGWVFQERMLAPRILHFAKHQIFWDCAEVSACETLPSGLPQALDGAAASDRHWRGRLQESGSPGYVPVAGANDDSIEHFWKSAVERYTSCNLTSGNDKLVAIWGIAKLVRDILGEEYGAGFWEKYLEEQLAWRVAECELNERPAELSRNPSWSWASMKGAIRLPDRVQVRRCYVVKDHQNHPISVQLVGRRRAKPHRETSEEWREELAAMSNDIRSLEVTHRDVSEKGQDKPKATDKGQGKETDKEQSTDRDKEPELQNTSIPMQGYIGRARLRRNKTTRRWMLEFLKNAGGDHGDGVAEVFPDVKPKEGDADDENSYFAVLAMSETHAGNEMPSLRGLRNSDQEDIRYSGVGIMLKPSEQEHHFKRTGLIQFHELSARVWEQLQATSGGSPAENGTVNGLKFWLD